MNIKRIIARLEEIIAYSEEEFLTVGKSLHQIDEQVVRICDEAKILNTSMSHSAFATQLAYFDALRLDHGTMIPSTENIECLLDNIGSLLVNDQNQLRKMIHHIKGMQKTDMVLQMELAHIAVPAETFANLAKEVKIQAEDIKCRSDALLTTSLKLSVHIATSVNRVRSLFKTISANFSRLMDSSISRLGEMHRHHERSQTLSSSLTQSGTQLRSHLDAMVRRLQMHDIIRQQLQQVIKLLQEYSTADVPLPLLEQSASSLTRSNDTFFTAIEHIRLQLVSVNVQLTDLLQQCRLLVQQNQETSAADTAHFLPGNRHMDELVATISICAQTEGILNVLIGDITSDMAQNHHALQEIKDLGTDIELSAQNAAVSAENARHIDAALTVMAEQTQREISSMQRLLSQIMGTQQQIEGQAKNLIDIFREINRDIESLVEIMAEVDERLQPLESLQQQTTLRISQLSEHLEEILASISPLIDGFHSDSKNSSAIVEAIQLLGETLSELSSSRNGADASSVPPEQMALQNAEKTVQKQWINPDLKEFGAPADTSDGDLGEDVELF